MIAVLVAEEAVEEGSAEKRKRATGGGSVRDLGGSVFGRIAGGFGERFDVGVDFRADLFFHAVDEEDAVEVIDLVLDAAGEKAVAAEDMRDAAFVVIRDDDLVGPNDVAANLWKGKAALLDDVVVGVAFEFDDGVGECHRHEEFERRFGAIELPVEVDFGGAEIDDAELDGAADLLGREADAAGGVHGLDHGGGELGERRIEAGDFVALTPQNGVVVMNNWQRHRSVGAGAWVCHFALQTNTI